MIRMITTPKMTNRYSARSVPCGLLRAGERHVHAGEPVRDVRDQRATQDRARDVAGPTHDHAGQDQDRELEHERRRVDEAVLAGEQRTGETADERADGERPQLVLDRPHAHDLGGFLVLADGQPGPADPAAVEVARSR